MDKLFYLIALTLQMRSILSDNFENLDVKRDIELSTVNMLYFLHPLLFSLHFNLLFDSVEVFVTFF